MSAVSFFLGFRSSSSLRCAGARAVLAALALASFATTPGCLAVGNYELEASTTSEALVLAPGESVERRVVYEGTDEVSLRAVLESPTPLGDALEVELEDAHAPRGRCVREQVSRTDITGLARNEVRSSCKTREGRVHVRLTNRARTELRFGWHVVASMPVDDEAAPGRVEVTRLDAE